MRKIAKKFNINKVNILSEQRYLIDKGLINENINEEYYDELKPLEGYVDAEKLINNRLWFHTNRIHRNQGKNGMIGIYSVNKNGNRKTSINQYTNEVRIGSPIVFQTSESGAKQIQKSFDIGDNRRTLVAGISGVVIPTKSGDNGGMVKIQFSPLDESPWFYVVDDSEKKEIITASEVYFNATKSGEWEIYAKNPIYAEQKSLESSEGKIDINENSEKNGIVRLYHRIGNKKGFEIDELVKNVFNNGLIPNDNGEVGPVIWFSPNYDDYSKNGQFVVAYDYDKSKGYEENDGITYSWSAPFGNEQIPFYKLIVIKVPTMMHLGMVKDNENLIRVINELKMTPERFNNISGKVVIFADIFNQFVQPNINYPNFLDEIDQSKITLTNAL